MEEVGANKSSNTNIEQIEDLNLNYGDRNKAE